MFSLFSRVQKVDDSARLAEAAADARIRAALDHVSANVMLADADLNIVHLNKTVAEMFRKTEAEIRKDLPGFRADALVGARFDVFRRDTTLQEVLPSNLESTVESRLKLGGRTFRLLANPMRDAGGRRTGIVVEWTDLTDQLRREADEQRLAEEQARSAAENLRIKAALDNVSGNVMLADARNDIVYLNPAALGMFRGAADDIRLDIPGFDVERLVGANIDTFHRNPAHQHRLLADLRETLHSQFKIGGRTFRFIANPVFDAARNRLGTVVEWVDRTQEVAVEQEIQAMVSAAERGDLTKRISPEGKREFFKTLASGINGVVGNVAMLVKRIKDAVRSVQSGAEEISRGNSDLSQRTEEQASSLEQTASSMEQMTSTVRQTADNAGQANQLAMAARQQAERGGAVVSSVIAAMGGINDASRKIADIIGVIDEIAFQTNLLALNAAVEAARAGEQGRGFAVVASEVRSLAGRSATAAKEIKALIKDSESRVEQGSRLVDESGHTLEEIVNAVKKVTDIVAEIAAASREQSAGIEQVNKAVMAMDSTTQQNAAVVEQAAAASQAIVEQAQALEVMVAAYRVDDTDMDAVDPNPGRNIPECRPQTRSR